MDLIVDRSHLGTPEAAWRSSDRLASLPLLDVGSYRRVILVAPHPDDEVLGAGGLLQSLLGSDTPVEVLAVTDGEWSHPDSSVADAHRLGTIRPRETQTALRRLGWETPEVTRLGVPDGRVAEHEGQVCEALAERAHQDDLWLVPWWRDGHPDHDACGRAASTAATHYGVRLLGYLFWAWHWADPGGEDLPWRSCRRFELDPSSAYRKRWSIDAFDSQIRPHGPTSARPPVLPPEVLERCCRNFEVFVEGGGGRWPR